MTRPLAIVSGGSSGIGLSAAKRLIARGYDLVLIARGQARLEAAREALLAGFRSGDPPRVSLRVLDVTEGEACRAVIEEVEASLGPIAMLVAAAGQAVPGRFGMQALADHHRQMQVNYFGALALAHALAPRMAKRGSGHILLVSSGAAFAGIHGYSAYGPSKFALRGLAETLRVELAGDGVCVSIAYPPDTDTPQYRVELQHKPIVTRRISAQGGLHSADTIGAGMIDQALKGKFVITSGVGLRLLAHFHSLYAPFFRWQQRRLIARFGPD